mmetsp:Transcript_36748/g.91546  ORF Transcript_36748/g.91546 Transcript_36748/m.91546 type:complete len:537 (-) Transcript_36748:720-2330(-)
MLRLRRHSWPCAAVEASIDPAVGLRALASSSTANLQQSLTLGLARQLRSLKSKLDKGSRRHEKAQAERASLAQQLAASRAEAKRLLGTLLHAGLHAPGAASSASGQPPSNDGGGSSSGIPPDARTADAERYRAQHQQLEALQAELAHTKKQLTLATGEKETAWATLRKASQSALKDSLRTMPCSISTTTFETDSSYSLPTTPGNYDDPLLSALGFDSQLLCGGAPRNRSAEVLSTASTLRRPSRPSNELLALASAEAAEAASASHALALSATGERVAAARSTLLCGYGELRRELRAAYFIAVAVQHRRHTPQHVIQHLMARLVRTVDALEAIAHVSEKLANALSFIPNPLCGATPGSLDGSSIGSSAPQRAAQHTGHGHSGLYGYRGSEALTERSAASIVLDRRSCFTEAPAHLSESATRLCLVGGSPGEGVSREEGGTGGGALLLGEVWRWDDDEAIVRCNGCLKNFGLLRWKHHCRVCGRICCNDCSLHRYRLCNLEPSAAVRICDCCHAHVRHPHFMLIWFGFLGFFVFWFFL